MYKNEVCCLTHIVGNVCGFIYFFSFGFVLSLVLRFYTEHKEVRSMTLDKQHYDVYC